MQAINRVIFTGNLGADPELRSTASGMSVCEMGVAVNGREKVGDSWQDRVDWVDVTVWGSQAENCAKYLSKGSPVAVDGRLRQDRWQNDAGENRSKLKVVAERVQFLSSKSEREEGAAPPDVPVDDSGFKEKPAEAAPAAKPDEDIPF
jgi:single-strand DNA-binding protein